MIGKKYILSIFPILVVVLASMNMPRLYAQEETIATPNSQNTRMCLGCHVRFTPGLVEDWYTSRHAKITPAQALQTSAQKRRMSAESVPDELLEYVVGCYECHSLNTDQHDDSFEHMGSTINVIVSPNDCQTCHPVEVEQYSGSKKAHAYNNLMGNAIYSALAGTITGMKTVDTAGNIAITAPALLTLNDTCLACHGTTVEVEGMQQISTQVGPMQVPKLTNWPNQGVGRKNPDGSLGSCTSCHARHAFSIVDARKPYTCSQCHGEPDVPAWPVYKVSKHGNIFSAHQEEWDFGAVPWKVGEDFTAPTCATCHNSLVTLPDSEQPDNEVIVERTHNFGDRLYTRIFGLIYSHPQPQSGDTTIIKNADGLPLPTTFLGQTANEFLIDEAEQQVRLATMKSVCKNCHSTDWTDRHFEKFEHTVGEVDQMVLASTALMSQAWEKGIAEQANPFDEAIEQLWVKQWLFYANTVRYASAMTGAQKYTAFTDGWWDLTHNLQKMHDQLKAHRPE